MGRDLELSAQAPDKGVDDIEGASRWQAVTVGRTHDRGQCKDEAPCQSVHKRRLRPVL